MSASESEGEEGREIKEETGVLELGGLKIPVARVVDLLQVAKRIKLTLCVLYVIQSHMKDMIPELC